MLQLHLYERDADALLGGLARAHYLWSTGRWPIPGLVPLFERYPDVVSLYTYEQLLDVEIEPRQAAHLRAFALDIHIRAATAAHTDRLAAAERQASVEWMGDAISLDEARKIAGLLPDRAPRHELDENIRDAEQALVRQRLDALRAERQCVSEFEQYGLPTDNLAFWADVRGADIDALSALARLILESTADLYANALRDQIVHHDLDGADVWDVDLAWILRGTQYDRVYPAISLMPSAIRTLGDLGVRLEEQSAVRIDLAPAATKGAGVLCAPIAMPEDVVVSFDPRGGRLDYQRLLRGLGAAERHVHQDHTQPFAYRRLGDLAVLAGYGGLLAALTGREDWLQLRLNAEAVRDAVRLSAFERLYQLRRAAVSHLYECELRSAEEPEAMADRYVDLFSDTLGIRAFPERYLDVVAGRDALTGAAQPLTGAGGMRAAAFACQLGGFLAAEYDADWFRSGRAGRFLVDRWREGQRYTAEEMVRFLGYDGLDIRPLIEELRAGLEG
ncbi:MAG: hypothetical protein IT305_08915 [Chloroflexi bacterium]|nr:hypothetical protein [Chloroflexota bacterium]